MKTVALHVISEAGFGVPLPFLAADQVDVPEDSWRQDDFGDLGPRPAKGHRLTFAQSIHTLLRYLIPVMVIPKSLLRIVPIPTWKSAYSAFSEFRTYTMLLTARAKGNASHDEGHANLLRALVSRTADDDGVPDRLSDDEVLAHLFVFILAGHESTASVAPTSLLPCHSLPFRNALSYAILNLAIYGDVQEWFLQELDKQLGAHGADPQDWAYDAVFDQLSASICVMVS